MRLGWQRLFASEHSFHNPDYSPLFSISQTELGHGFLPIPISTLGGWHYDAHRAVLSVASGIASLAMAAFDRATSIVFQRHAAPLATNNGSSILSGCVAIA